MKVRKLACTPQQDRKVINVGRIDSPDQFFLESSIYGCRLKTLVDTELSRTIVRPDDLVNVWRVQPPGKTLVLTTATGESMEA